MYKIRPVEARQLLLTDGVNCVEHISHAASIYVHQIHDTIFYRYHTVYRVGSSVGV